MWNTTNDLLIASPVLDERIVREQEAVSGSVGGKTEHYVRLSLPVKPVPVWEVRPTQSLLGL